MLPFLIQTKNFVLPTYYVIISIVCTIAIWWSAKRAENKSLKRNTALDLTLLVFITGFIGARLVHVFYEFPQIYLKDPIRIFKFWEGGFVFYGGAVFALVAGVFFIIRKREPIGAWLDLAAPIAAFGYAFGRLGCLAAGCCFGRECYLPWAITFPYGVEAPPNSPLHPTQIYAFLWETFVLLFLLIVEKETKKGGRLGQLLSKEGDLFFIWMMLHALGRILMENFRADYRGIQIGGLSLSTLISIVFIAAGLFFYLRQSFGIHQNKKERS